MHVQSCLTVCNTMDYNPSGSSVHGIFQARILEWVAIPFSNNNYKPVRLHSRLETCQIQKEECKMANKKKREQINCTSIKVQKRRENNNKSNTTFLTQNKSTNQSCKVHESAKSYKHILQKSTQDMNLFKMNLIFRINIRFKIYIIMKLNSQRRT